MDRRTIHIIDSHTAGEPTRVVIEGGPELGGGTLPERLPIFRDRFDHYRSAVVNEPRGSDVLVGALLLPPSDPACAAAVIFFNNVGYLGMCGHGTIGVVATLAHLGRIPPGECRLETPVGAVRVHLREDGRVSVRNVPSYRAARQVAVEVPGHGRLHGDVAWGGNWFFISEDHGQELTLSRAPELTDFTLRVRSALEAHGITGDERLPIDHVELVGAPIQPEADGRNFVLCPGGAYDRSPCGTGTSAKLACLHADGKLRPGQVWRQESITGSIFEGTVEERDGQVLPTITGRAFITGEARLILDPSDPLCWGIHNQGG